MRIVGVSRSAGDVKTALETAKKEINEKLEGLNGRITRFNASVDAGVGGASVEVTVCVEGIDPVEKKILGVNERGVGEQGALKRAEQAINEKLEKTQGEVAGFHVKTITTPLQRTYTTIIAAVNKYRRIDPKGLHVKQRRERLKGVIRSLGDNPHALNISKVAEIFDVSRDIIYRDLEELGYRRIKE